MITLIKRWLEKRRERRKKTSLEKTLNEWGIIYHGELRQFFTHEEWEEYNSPLQQAIRSRGGYL